MLHQQGTFVFRLAGRERQQSASYYTPEVLTRFIVVAGARGAARPGRPARRRAAEILELTICEPALGSGAFAIEAVRQLAERVPQAPPGGARRADRPRRVPARAAEGQGLPRAAPGLRRRPQRHRRRAGRDLAVARHHGRGPRRRRGSACTCAAATRSSAPARAVYSRARSRTSPGSRRVDRRPLTGSPRHRQGHRVSATSGRIHHFLLPAEGWGAAADVGKEVEDLVPDAVAALKTWRSSTKAKPTKKQVDGSIELGRAGRDAVGDRAAAAARSPSSRSAATSRSGAGEIEPPSGHRQRSRASRSRRRSPTRTAPTAGCAWSWTPGARCGSGRSPRHDSRSRPTAGAVVRRAAR